MDIYQQFLKKGWRPNWFHHPSPENSLLEMVFIESRVHENTPYVLANVSHMIPYAALTIIHSKSNESQIKKIIPNGTNIRMLCIIPDDLTIKIYSDILKNTYLWELLISPKILIFQIDSGIRYNNILEFIHYDYIGAPWNINWGYHDKACFVGNGGFSLRSRKAMIDICKHKPYIQSTTIAEDIFFSRELSILPEYEIASVSKAMRFSTETIYYPNSFGFHKPWEIHSKQILQELFNVDAFSKNILTIENIILTKEDGTDIHIDTQLYKYLYQWFSLGIGPNGLVISEQAKFPIEHNTKICAKIYLSNGSMVLYVF